MNISLLHSVNFLPPIRQTTTLGKNGVCVENLVKRKKKKKERKTFGAKLQFCKIILANYIARGGDILVSLPV